MTEIQYLTRKSIIGQLGEEKEHPQVRSPAGNPKLDYSRGLVWNIIGDTAVYMYPDAPGEFFDAQLNPVDDTTAARSGYDVPTLKAQKRRNDRLFKLTAEIDAMARAELEAAKAVVQEDAPPITEPTVKEINDLAELAAEHGERAFPVKS
jgi:hypothetical protein